MKKNILIINIIYCVFSTNSFSQEQPSFVTDSLDSYIQQGMKDWNIPGLAIAIVKDRKVV